MTESLIDTEDKTVEEKAASKSVGIPEIIPKIPAIIIPNFLSSIICQKLVRNIITSKTSRGCGITQKIGESVNSYISKKIQYFKKTKLTNKHLRNIFSDIDPRETMLNQISKTWL